jgi:uncharacterized protein YndB with AHSA1/START domain
VDRVQVVVQRTLPASPETVWRVLADWEAQPRWMKDASSVRVLGAGREGAGVRLAVQTRVFHVPLFTEELEVTGWEPVSTIVIEHRSFIRGTGRWELQSAGEGTEFRWSEELSLPIPLLGELALLAYRPFLRHMMRGTLDGLAAYVGGVET